MTTRSTSKMCKLLERSVSLGSRTEDSSPACSNFYAPFRLLNLTHSRRRSSHEWLLRQGKDPYVKKAKAVSYRARSAFKLLEIDEKYKIFQPGQVVIDLGAAPGSWSQVAIKKVNAFIPPDSVKDTRDPQLVEVDRFSANITVPLENENPAENTQIKSNINSKKNPQGLVIGVDLIDITPFPGAIFLKDSDFTSLKVQKKILDLLEGRPVDVVMSDMAPNASGMRGLDHDAIIGLCTEALSFSLKVLQEKGTFLCKIWSGSSNKDFENLLKRYFSFVKFVKPPASRDDSAETYFLAMGFRKDSKAIKDR